MFFFHLVNTSIIVIRSEREVHYSWLRILHCYLDVFRWRVSVDGNKRETRYVIDFNDSDVLTWVVAMKIPFNNSHTHSSLSSKPLNNLPKRHCTNLVCSRCQQSPVFASFRCLDWFVFNSLHLDFSIANRIAI